MRQECDGLTLLARFNHPGQDSKEKAKPDA